MVCDKRTTSKDTLKLSLVADAYVRALEKYDRGFTLYDLDKVPRYVYERFMSKVEKAYERLDPLEKEFVNKEFFYNSYPFWWVGIYSKSSFYRLRNKCANKFVQYYEKI